MGELARQKRARDLWISSNHLWAMAAGAMVLAGLAFVGGYQLGRSHAPPAPEPIAWDEADEAQLVELLARVEASAQARGGVESLTFPEALTGRTAEHAVPGGAPTPMSMAVVEPGEGEPPLGDPLPAGRYTVELGRFTDEAAAVGLRDALREQELPAWVEVSLVDGVKVRRLGVGGYPAEADAVRALQELQPHLEALELEGAVVAPLP